MDVQTRGKIILGKAVVIENYMDPEMIEFAIQQAEGFLEAIYKEKVSLFASSSLIFQKYPKLAGVFQTRLVYRPKTTKTIF